MPREAGGFLDPHLSQSPVVGSPGTLSFPVTSLNPVVIMSLLFSGRFMHVNVIERVKAHLM